MEAVVSGIKSAVKVLPVGNALQLEAMRSLGASPELLERWEFGWPVARDTLVPADAPSHPSLAASAARVSAEWDRLAALGKIVWFAEGAPKPAKLHVNPCAAIVKDRPGADPSLAEELRTKLRVIVDLRRGGVNSIAVDEGVDFASLEKVLGLMRPRDFVWVIDLTDAFYNWPVAEAWVSLTRTGTGAENSCSLRLV